jgi:hypothetical protein
MERNASLAVDGSTPPVTAGSRLWYLALAGLVVWQGWITLTLFGGDDPWQTLTDTRPIVSAKHPLHLYHGYLGARSLRERGCTSCYDPAFQAGYPKTPVFDSGSRPAELFLLLAGGRFRPEAYKIGLAMCCVLVPVFLWATVRGMGLDRATAWLATAISVLACWSHPCREALESGDLDLFLAALASLATLGFLVQFHRTSGVAAWLALVVTQGLGWYAEPIVFASLFPLFLLYYFGAGPKHGLFWHLALWAASAAGILVNSFWLFDWLGYWWIRTPFQLEAPVLSHRTFHTFWEAPQWGGDYDRILVLAVLSLAAVGIVALRNARERLVARLLTLGVGGAIVLVLAGVGAETFGKLSTPRLLIPALWGASIPAAYALRQGARIFARRLGGRFRSALALAALTGVMILAVWNWAPSVTDHFIGTRPLAIGLERETQGVIDVIGANTNSDSRVLIEQDPREQSASRWSALLPVLTNRSYMGGLIPDANIEHAFASLVGESLAGRPISKWSDAELVPFCRRYNIGWVLCRSEGVRTRFRRLPSAHEIVSNALGQHWTLTRLQPASYFLKGQGRVLRADYRHIALADVVPEDGTVLLSMHYQPGMQVSPGRVQIEKEPDAQDPVPFIRLRVPGPVARLTLSWNAP